MKLKKLVLILVAISMVLSMTACGTASGENTESTSDETGFFGDKQEEVDDNVLEGSYIIKQGDWIYYSLSNKLYKSKEDGSEQTSLARGENRIKSLVVVDDYIYFCDGNLNVVKTDGSEQQVLVEEEGTGVNIVDGWVYYGNEYKVKVGSTEVEQFYESKTVGVLEISDKWIFFTELNEDSVFDSISRMKLDGSERQDIYDGLVRKMEVSGEWIYFVNERDQSLYRMKTDGSDLQTIVETPAGNFGSFDIKDEWIYFTRSASLHKVKIDGTEKEMLYYTGMDSPQIIDDVIYLKKILSNGDQELYRIDIDAKYEEQAELLAEE